MEGHVAAVQTARRKVRAGTRGRRSPAGARGSILLIVLITVAMLTMLVLLLAGIRVSCDREAAADRESAQRYYAACSGIEIARAMLEEDAAHSVNDTLGEAWKAPREYEIGGYRCDVKITDENSKLNIAYLAEDPVTQARLARLMTYVVKGMDFTRAMTLIDNACREMKKELGGTGMSGGAENLMRFPGFTRAIVLGGKDEKSGLVSAGLVNYVTAQMCWLVNVNTASREVLLCLSETFSASLVDKIMERRSKKDEDGRLRGAENITDLQENETWPEEQLAALQASCSTTSDCFTVVVTVTPAGADEERGEKTAAARAQKMYWTVYRPAGGNMSTISLRMTD